MNNHSDFNAEMQQVSAYPTKQKVGQEDVALLNEQESCCSPQSSCCTPKKTQASEAQQE